MGDLNYRMNTCSQHFNNEHVSTDAVNLIPSLDQLVLSRKEGNYPNYEEAPITFLPTYKLSKTDPFYIDKKD